MLENALKVNIHRKQSFDNRRKPFLEDKDVQLAADIYQKKNYEGQKSLYNVGLNAALPKFPQYSFSSVPPQETTNVDEWLANKDYVFKLPILIDKNAKRKKEQLSSTIDVKFRERIKFDLDLETLLN